MLTTRFYPDHGGGALQALRLCQKLTERRVKTFVITGHKGDNVVKHTIQGIPVTRLPLPQREGLAVLPFYIRTLSRLIIQHRDYDLIHAHAIHHHAYAGFLVGWLLGKPAIAKISGLQIDTPASIKARRLGGIQIRLMLLATRLVATSQELYDQTINGGIPVNQLVRIPNGIDTTLFCPASGEERIKLRQNLKLPEKALILTLVGAVRPVKGVDILAKAWPKLATSIPDLHICLVGAYRKEEHWGIDPEYIARLKQLFSLAPDSETRVHFVGQTSNVVDYLQATDLFVLPSRSEGMPNALLEAMACSLPFVASRLGGVEEMVPIEQRPYLTPVDDAEALAEAIITLAHDAHIHRKLGVAGRRQVEANYSLDTIADRYVKLYHDLLAEQRS